MHLFVRKQCESFQLRLTDELIKPFTMNAPNILNAKNVLVTIMFPHRTLMNQLGCTCDNNFIIIKMNPDHGSGDHRLQQCQGTI